MCLTRGRRRDREKRGELDATGKREQRGWWKLSRTRRWMQRPGERVRERCTACILKRHFMVTADWSSPFRHAHRAANGKKGRSIKRTEGIAPLDGYLCIFGWRPRYVSSGAEHRSRSRTPTTSRSMEKTRSERGQVRWGPILLFRLSDVFGTIFMRLKMEE